MTTSTLTNCSEARAHPHFAFDIVIATPQPIARAALESKVHNVCLTPNLFENDAQPLEPLRIVQETIRVVQDRTKSVSLVLECTEPVSVGQGRTEPERIYAQAEEVLFEISFEAPPGDFESCLSRGEWGCSGTVQKIPAPPYDASSLRPNWA
eukprot:SAG11_NODE_16473_length_546_cov_1.143177_1_plen_151_part_10